MVNTETNGLLSVVATPIGNLGDLSPRALEVLRDADLIAAEDTRTAAMLLQKYGVTGAKMLPNHKFNEEAAAGKLVEELQCGKHVALITDAGTPCISDPGYVLVREAVRAGIPVTSVPGCCAAITAITVSGFSALSFGFYGFLPRTAGEIRKVFARVAGEYSTLAVFYESPNRIVKTVALLAECLPDCKVCLCNDLTKKFEKIYRGTPAEVLAELEANPNADKGEYVLVLETAARAETAESGLSPEAMLVDRMVRDGVGLREAVKLLAEEKKAPKGVLYDAGLRLKEWGMEK